jgi:D-alanyl-D-alanine carboxypeptidase/D-alanyl-D-alanine-endopeptidase (penicillin-binding protein 4)
LKQVSKSWILLAFVLWMPLALASSLPPSVLSALQSAGIPPGDVAVTVQEVASRKPLLNWNGGKAMNPASVMKLLTTWTALETLGPAYVWRTEVYYKGKLAGGVLDGDLYFKGSGDPDLTIERFGLLLRELRARGLKEIKGDLVLDRGRFQVDNSDPAAFDGEGLSAYNTLPDALLLNFKALRLTLVPGAKKVAALPVPELAGLLLENHIESVPGDCGEWDEGLKADWDAAGVRLVLSGSFPAACGERVWNLSLMDPAEYLYRAFHPLWRELGGSLAGRLRQASVPTDAHLLASTVSPPLAQIIRDINKFSNNVMARQVFLSLGAEALSGERPATPADGEGAVRAFLEQKKLTMPELVMENGAGLSRCARISAMSLNRLLLAAWASPTMPEFLSSLPIVAVDGTMRKRLTETGLAGRAHLKTGSLGNAKTLAGYVNAKNGKRYAVVFLANHANASLAKPAQDALLLWVWAGAR